MPDAVAPAGAAPTTPPPTQAAPTATPPAPAGTAAPAKPPLTGADIQAKIAAEQAKRQTDNLRKEVETLRARAAEADALKAKWSSLTTDPEPVLREALGEKWYDALTDRALNGGRLTPEMVAAQVAAQLKARDEKAAADKAAAEADEVAEGDATRTAWVAEVEDLVRAEPAKYRLINLHNSQRNVAEHIEQTYKKTKRLMSNQEGAESLEQVLRKAVLDSVDDSIYAELQKSRAPVAAPKAPPQFSALHGSLTSTTPSTTQTLTPLKDRMAAALAKSAQGQKG